MHISYNSQNNFYKSSRNLKRQPITKANCQNVPKADDENLGPTVLVAAKEAILASLAAVGYDHELYFNKLDYTAALLRLQAVGSLD